MTNKNTDILLLNRSFWPDTEATGQFLTELCEVLVKKYKVTAIAGRSFYMKKDVFGVGEFYKSEVFNGIHIVRVRHAMFWKKNLLGRITNWITYSALAFFAALKIKPKVIIVCTDPPFLGIIAAVLSYFKSTPFIYNCRDLYPDVAIELGKLNKGNLLGRIFDLLNIKALNSARAVICLGQSMESRIRKKGVTNKYIEIIPDGVDTSRIKPVLKNNNPYLEKFGLRDKFIIMHSGNIGLSQDFSPILKAMNNIRDDLSFYLVFIGEGAGKALLEQEAASMGFKNVLFLSYQPLDMLSFSLGMADLHLITLKEGLAGAIVPSKVYGIMSAGRPYLAITDRESEPARFAREFGCGLWAPPGDLDAIAKAIDWARAHPEDLGKMGQAGRKIAETRFDKFLVSAGWLSALSRII